MKKYRFFSAVLVFSAIFSFSSCQSEYSFRVPGESEIITTNISLEYFAIADEYLNLKNYQKAVQYYKLAMKNKSLNAAAYYKLARSYALAKDYESAEKCYTKLLSVDPENKDLQISLAYIKGMSGKTEEATRLYKGLIEKFPNDSSLLENYLTLLLFSENLEESEKQYQILLEKFPDNANLQSLSDKIEKLREKLQPKEETESLADTPKTPVKEPEKTSNL